MAIQKEPITIDDKSWYYEEADGIVIITQYDVNDDTHTTQTKIPWSTLLESLERYHDIL